MSNELMERPANELVMSERQEKFVEAFVGEARFNATKAAEIAGYSKAAVSGWECMQHPAVKHAVKQRTQATAMHSDELLMLLGHEARGPGDYIDVVTEDVWEGEGDEARLVTRERIVVDVKRMKKDGKRSLIKKVTRGPHGDSVEFVDPLAAQAILVKVHNLVPETNLEQALGDAVRVRAMAELAKMISAGRQGNSVGGTLSVTGVTDAPDEAGDTTDVVISPAAIGRCEVCGELCQARIDADGKVRGCDGSVTNDAANAPTLPGEARADTAATLGTCQVCGELPADKVTRGGARVCSVCIP